MKATRREKPRSKRPDIEALLASGQLSVSDARKHFKALFEAVSTQKQATVRIHRHGRDEVFVTRTQRGESGPEWMARQVAIQFLGASAPTHLIEPQVKELASLALREIAAVMMLDDLPPKNGVPPILAGHERIIDRLAKRRAVAKAIESAERDGLYDSNEHMTSSQAL